MKREILLGMMATIVVLACGAAGRADVIDIPNGDFRTPDASVNPYADPNIGSWQKGVQPA